MTKLSNELKGKTPEEQDHVLNHVGHIDLKGEYKLLVNEGLAVDDLIKSIKKTEPIKEVVKPIKKVVDKKKAK